MKTIKVPATDNVIADLQVGDRIEISGKIYTGRDAALPKLVKSIKNGEKLIDIQGSAVMHTAVSDAGISPTTSNKEEIQENIPYLAKAGVKIHIGKGSLSEDTIKALAEENSIFVVTPPAAALLTSKVKSKKVAAFAEEGMEAIFELEVDGIPGIVAVAHGKSIYK
ncbi:MAG TPA: fumarate hydratase C-terminal domain-containing protein [Methanobacterium sp.]|nr:fumarate hydratase C-terminal domain-containing protein [Methanobacterium sp.]